MEIQIIKIECIPAIPSASGIAYIKPYVFIIGDDSNFLFVLDEAWKIIAKVQLYSATEFKSEGRIRKKYKKDLEGLTKINLKGNEYVLAMGSGATAAREDAYLIQAVPPFAVTALNLSRFYSILSNEIFQLGSHKLNVEGIASDDENLYLLQRGNISGCNSMLSMKTEDLLSFLDGFSPILPNYTATTFNLPKIGGLMAGFSGADMIANTSQLVFSASVENTINEIDDGEPLCSYIGIIDLKTNNYLSDIVKIEPELVGKLESIAFVGTQGNKQSIIAVTDNDGKDSQLIAFEITI